MKDFTHGAAPRAGLHHPIISIFQTLFQLDLVSSDRNSILYKKDKLCQKSVCCCIMGKKKLDNTRGVHKK